MYCTDVFFDNVLDSSVREVRGVSPAEPKPGMFVLGEAHLTDDFPTGF